MGIRYCNISGALSPPLRLHEPRHMAGRLRMSICSQPAQSSPGRHPSPRPPGLVRPASAPFGSSGFEEGRGKGTWSSHIFTFVTFWAGAPSLVLSTRDGLTGWPVFSGRGILHEQYRELGTETGTGPESEKKSGEGSIHVYVVLSRSLYSHVSCHAHVMRRKRDRRGQKKLRKKKRNLPPAVPPFQGE